MPAYRTPEYEHLLAAERSIAGALQPRTVNDNGELLAEPIYPDAKDIAALASALVRVIDQKRVMRGQPAPKPMEMQRKSRRSTQLSASLAYPDPAAPAPASADPSSTPDAP